MGIGVIHSQQAGTHCPLWKRSRAFRVQIKRYVEVHGQYLHNAANWEPGHHGRGRVHTTNLDISGRRLSKRASLRFHID